MPGVFFLIIRVAVALTALADLGRVLVCVQPALELLGSALLVWRRVPFALLLAQGLKFLLDGVVTRPGRIVTICSQTRSPAAVRSRGRGVLHHCRRDPATAMCRSYRWGLPWKIQSVMFLIFPRHA